jgi:hypothetical protein
MTPSLTDWLQKNRFVVVSVDTGGHRIRVREDVCTDLLCHEQTVVVTEDGTPAGLDALHPGDTVKVESEGERPQRIVVLRRVWEDLASPEL